MQNTSLKELYVEELRDIYDAENQLVKALPEMAKAATSQEVLKNWALLKAEEKKALSPSAESATTLVPSVLDGISRGLPALLEALQLTRRAAQVGFDWDTVEGIFAKLREETTKFARKMMKVNPAVMRYTKEAVRAVGDMNVEQARDYLRSKQDSLARNDKEIREKVGMKQFLDEKTYRPGLGPYQRTDA